MGSNVHQRRVELQVDPRFGVWSAANGEGRSEYGCQESNFGCNSLSVSCLWLCGGTPFTGWVRRGSHRIRMKWGIPQGGGSGAEFSKKMLGGELILGQFNFRIYKYFTNP